MAKIKVNVVADVELPDGYIVQQFHDIDAKAQDEKAGKLAAKNAAGLVAAVKKYLGLPGTVGEITARVGVGCVTEVTGERCMPDGSPIPEGEEYELGEDGRPLRHEGSNLKVKTGIPQTLAR